MSRLAKDELVLAIYLTRHGLAYALFVSPLTPIDWGVRRAMTKDKNAHCLEIVRRLCEALRPEVLVIEDCDAEGSRRSPRVRRLNRLIASYAQVENLTVLRYSRPAIRETFREAGAITRHEVAQAIASYIPALALYLPRPRKTWQSEDRKLALFDAAALALTYYAALPREAEEPP